MTTTLWLLVSIGAHISYQGGAPTQVVERFVTQEECQRVAKAIFEPTQKARLQCVEAKVAR
jgi:hypothetical protein